MQKHIHFDVMRVAISTTHTDRRFPSSGKFAFGRAISPSFCPVHPPPRCRLKQFLIYSMGRLTVTPNHPKQPQFIPFLHRKMYISPTAGINIYKASSLAPNGASSPAPARRMLKCPLNILYIFHSFLIYQQIF